MTQLDPTTVPAAAPTPRGHDPRGHDLRGHDFAVGEEDFLLDGRPHRVLAGALHYFRVHPDQWAERIGAARALGLNTIETYVPWNAHAPHRGEFLTPPHLDLARFLDLVGEAGMHAVVRPGPYICAEWDNGGLPVWLTRSSARLRTDDPAYLEAVGEFLRDVYEIVVPRQVDRGGPVVLVQIENEYGAYSTGNGPGDAASRVAHLRALVDLTRAAGVVVPLTTVDQPTDEMLAAGTLPDLLTTGSFGGRSAERLATLRRHQPRGPLMCSEFWVGWFDHWGSHHRTTDAAAAAAELQVMLDAGASVNVYMFHGGTNFGLTSGANDKGGYQPTTTSYDYDALLDEAGRPTAKYRAFAEVIARFLGRPAPVAEVSAPPAAPVLESPLTSSRPLLAAAGATGRWTRGVGLPAFDDLDPVPQLVLARTASPGSAGPAVLSVTEVRDRATVFLAGVRLGGLERERHDRALVVPAHPRGAELLVLVEDAGRVNYGSRLGEVKGLVGPVLLDDVELTDWEVLPVDLEALPSTLPGPRGDGTGPGAVPPARLSGPVLARGELHVPEPSDLFLDTATWGRGIVWFNGWNLGRYWRRGPQRSLFVPRPVVRAGANAVVVLELEVGLDPVVRTLPAADLGPTEA